MVMDGTFSGSKYPVTGSHEPCGTVVRVGEDARGVKVGDRVAALLPVEICRESDVSSVRREQEQAGRRDVVMMPVVGDVGVCRETLSGNVEGTKIGDEDMRKGQEISTIGAETSKRVQRGSPGGVDGRG